MYDKNRIEDSLEFVRQMKEFMDSDDALDEFDPFEDNDSDELFVNLAYHMEPEVPPKENAVQSEHGMGDSFGVPDAGVIQEQRRLAEERLRLEQEEARRKQAEQEQQRRLEEERRRLEEEAARRRQAEQEQHRRLEAERRRLEEEAAKRRQAEQEQQRQLEAERRRLEQEAERRRQAELQEKQRQEAERKKIEEERKRLAEEQKRQEEARRQLEEERRLALEEAKRREAELAEKKRLEEERQRLAQEEARRKEAELAEKKRLEEERKRLEQEAERRRQAELQEKQRQEAERQKIEEERRRLAEEQKRQEQLRRQLEQERQRLVEEQLQRELEEQRRILAEQARQKAEAKAKKEAEEKERRRKLVQEEEQRKKELQAREEEQRRKAQEEEKKQEEQRKAAESKQDPEMSKAPAGPESEVERLRKRAEELKRQAEMATLEARMRQLQLEAEGISTGESVITPQADTVANGFAANSTPLSGAASDGTAAGGNSSIPMPMLSIPGVQPGTMASGAGQQTISHQNDVDKQKLSKEEIDSIFAKELKKSGSDSSYQQRKMMLQKQAERLKRKREETGDKLPLELAKEKAVQAKDFTMGTVGKIREFVLDKMTDPENAESREKVKKIMTNALVVMICIAAAFLVSSIVTNFVAHPTKVEGESMETTLTDGDTVIIQKLSYYFGTPDRYDVVIFPIYNSKTYFIKRVIGLPGETVQIEEGKVYINGKELEDDIYGKDEYIDDPGDAGEPITLASDEYFVLGDNRNMSTDSRSSYVGVIKKRNIAGKAWRRVLPFSKSGKVK